MSVEIPEQLKALAHNMNIDVETLLAAMADQQEQSPQTEVPAAENTAEAKAVPTETREQALERELAVSREETNQVRKLAQTASQGRVIGSGGETYQGLPPAIPNIGGIEPGIRWLYANGLITAEDLEKKIGPLLAELLKGHVGGVI